MNINDHRIFLYARASYGIILPLHCEFHPMQRVALEVIIKVIMTCGEAIEVVFDLAPQRATRVILKCNEDGDRGRKPKMGTVVSRSNRA